MKQSNQLFVLGLALGLALFTGSVAMAQGGSASVAGAWTLTMTGQRGTSEQTLKLEQNGNTVTGTITGRRGDSPVKGSVTGNELTFSVTRETPRGTFTMNYKATVDGDSMKGTAGNDRFSLDFTGKRTASSQ
ncbi:MAG TPA: hypothetical protein VFQ24_01705 [Terriglobia bacterium]|nr:hypothetical protein [Terriglobia bacterium]